MILALVWVLNHGAINGLHSKVQIVLSNLKYTRGSNKHRRGIYWYKDTFVQHI